MKYRKDMGVITKARFGFYNFEHKDVIPYLQLTIQIFDGSECVMRFDFDKVKYILQSFLPHYTGKFIDRLVGQKVYLKTEKNIGINRAPCAIKTYTGEWVTKIINKEAK